MDAFIEEAMDDEFAAAEALDAFAQANQLLEKGGVLRALVEKARERAMAANDALIFTDPTKTDLIAALQKEIRLYRAYCEDIQSIIETGKAIVEETSEADREFLRALQKGELDQEEN